MALRRSAWMAGFFLSLSGKSSVAKPGEVFGCCLSLYTLDMGLCSAQQW